MEGDRLRKAGIRRDIIEGGIAGSMAEFRGAREAEREGDGERGSEERGKRSSVSVSNILKGEVKWFSDAKGFGFIRHSSGRDVFVHYTSIEGSGFKTLKEGEIVEYALEERERGLYAVMVRRVRQEGQKGRMGVELYEAQNDWSGRYGLGRGVSHLPVSLNSYSGSAVEDRLPKQ